MARRQAVLRSRGRSRQRVEWGISKMSDAVSLAANSVNVQTSSTSLLLLLDQATAPTIVRLRGDIIVQATGTATHAVLVGVGVAIVSTRAATIGPTAVPRPVTESDFSWMWHKFIHLVVKASSDTVGSVATIVRVEIDSKAMRKVLSTEEELVMVTETDNGAGNAGILFMGSLRVLVKEV